MTAAGVTAAASAAAVAADVGRRRLCRMYNYWYRGKDHYPIDRDACDFMTEFAPGWELVVRASREWLRHRVCDLATLGVDQFLVLGAGLPVDSEAAVHELASRSLERPARVVYVDADPLAALYNHVRLADDIDVHAVHADLTDPAHVLDRAHAAGSVVDWSRPVAALWPDSLSHAPDDPGPATMVRRYRALLAPGSWIVASHYTDPGPHRPAERFSAWLLQELFTGFTGSGWFRTPAEFEGCFDGLELSPPGITDLAAWPAAVPAATPLPMEARLILCGLARIPDPTNSPEGHADEH
ncbi:SAM-dependent methyltransferase [Nocardia wallacei]|uniref:SAM-dependent methyltransferase n=1 Tax=Nocardia wallacei TaxID=480035 RepID=UPI0024574D74|nr:SAM-dependent methyltransferase [Nocardia wallacei]